MDSKNIWEGCREGRRCSRDAYPESYITPSKLVHEIERRDSKQERVHQSTIDILARVGVPILKGAHAFRAGDYDAAVSHLAPVLSYNPYVCIHVYICIYIYIYV